jgi:hypothetical protein
MKSLFVSFLFSVISFISFSQSVILEYNQFNSFTSDKNFNVLTPSEVLQNKDIKTYQSEVCDIKYEIMVNEKKILIFNHGDLVGCEYLKSFQKTDTEIKFSFLTQDWYETEKKLTSFLVNLNTHTTLVYSNTENGLDGFMINNMGVSE